jgi:hypothetical protein
MDFWRRAARNSRLLEMRKEVIREKNEGNTNNF